MLRDPVAGEPNAPSQASFAARHRALQVAGSCYIKLFDEWIATQDIIRDTPTATGSRGQFRPHPLGATIQKLEHSLRSLETRYRLTPKDRVGLGIDITIGIDAGERLRRELEAAGAKLEAEAIAALGDSDVIIEIDDQ